MSSLISIIIIFSNFNGAWANTASPSEISFSEDELSTLSPFDPSVQENVLKDVILLMDQKWSSVEEAPQIRESESVQEDETEIMAAAESQGMPAWALAKGVNMYLFSLNKILLGKKMKIHNLAHEYAHYVQLRYKKYPQSEFSADYVEMEAVDIQNHFRPK